MIRLAMRGDDGRVGPDVWVSDVEGGLCIQKGDAYGVTHHSGLKVSGQYYRYLDAVALEQELLALSIDWTQSAEVLQVMWHEETLDTGRIKELLTAWAERYGVE
jgi:hypothetical protein